MYLHFVYFARQFFKTPDSAAGCILEDLRGELFKNNLEWRTMEAWIQLVLFVDMLQSFVVVLYIVWLMGRGFDTYHHSG